MPIKAGFCNNWYQACYDDLFCGVAHGSFFECANEYIAATNALDNNDEALQRWNDELTIIVVVLGVFVLVLGFGITYIVYREKKGDPVFDGLVANDAQAHGAITGGKVSQEEEI